MKCWMIDAVTAISENSVPLKMAERPKPIPGKGQLLLKIKTCGICHTEIDEIEGRTPPPVYPVIPGHQVIGTIVEHLGSRTDVHVGDRVGVAWIFHACGECEFCMSGQENLCPSFTATGRDVNGGYAEYMVADENFIYPIPAYFSDSEAAPLLCAGAIGYRSLSLCNIQEGQTIGLMGFGASAHLVLKLLRFRYPENKVYVFARSADERAFALQHGCSWAGDTNNMPPSAPDSIIDTTPAWGTVLSSLEFLKPGGRLVINAIRKEEKDRQKLAEMDYAKHLWMEKEIKSVANVTRKDVMEFIHLAEEMKFKPEVEEYPFENANAALRDIKNRNIRGAKVLIVSR